VYNTCTFTYRLINISNKRKREKFSHFLISPLLRLPHRHHPHTCSITCSITRLCASEHKCQTSCTRNGDTAETFLMYNDFHLLASCNILQMIYPQSFHVSCPFPWLMVDLLMVDCRLSEADHSRLPMLHILFDININSCF